MLYRKSCCAWFSSTPHRDVCIWYWVVTQNYTSLLIKLMINNEWLHNNSFNWCPWSGVPCKATVRTYCYGHSEMGVLHRRITRQRWLGNQKGRKDQHIKPNWTPWWTEEKKEERTMTTEEKQKTFSLLASKCGLFATHFYEFGNFLAKLATKTDHEHASGKSYHVGIRRKRLFFFIQLWKWSIKLERRWMKTEVEQKRERDE